jgi:hypothetical protein
MSGPVVLVQNFWTSVFAQSQKIWMVGVYTRSRISGAVYCRTQEIWERGVYTWSRISGQVVFLRSQEIWLVVFRRGPEFLDKLYFYVPRKSGWWCLDVVHKIWTSCIFTFPGIWASGVYTRSRISGPVVFSLSQEIWFCGVYTWSRKSGPFVFSLSQEIWYSGICTWSRKSG